MLPSGAPPDKVSWIRGGLRVPSDPVIAALGASVPCREAPDARGWRAVDTLAEPCSFGLEDRNCHHVAAGGARSHWIAAVTARTIGPDRATSAS
jgi:hypothetical protein